MSFELKLTMFMMTCMILAGTFGFVVGRSFPWPPQRPQNFVPKSSPKAEEHGKQA